MTWSQLQVSQDQENATKSVSQLYTRTLKGWSKQTPRITAFRGYRHPLHGGFWYVCAVWDHPVVCAAAAATLGLRHGANLIHLATGAVPHTGRRRARGWVRKYVELARHLVQARRGQWVQQGTWVQGPVFLGSGFLFPGYMQSGPGWRRRVSKSARLEDGTTTGPYGSDLMATTKNFRRFCENDS